MSARYTPVAIALHWGIAALIAGTFLLGLYMTELELSPQKIKLYSFHKWAGVTVFALAWLRLFWRLTHPAPALPATLSRREVRAARLAHGVLYGLMFAAPLSGWLMSSAGGFQTVWFGLVPLPDLLAKNRPLFELLKEVHSALNYTFAALVVVHVAAAFKHLLIDRDQVMAAMWPGGRQ